MPCAFVSSFWPFKPLALVSLSHSLGSSALDFAFLGKHGGKTHWIKYYKSSRWASSSVPPASAVVFRAFVETTRTPNDIGKILWWCFAISRETGIPVKSLLRCHSGYFIVYRLHAPSNPSALSPGILFSRFFPCSTVVEAVRAGKKFSKLAREIKNSWSFNSADEAGW